MSDVLIQTIGTVVIAAITAVAGVIVRRSKGGDGDVTDAEVRSAGASPHEQLLKLIGDQARELTEEKRRSDEQDHRIDSLEESNREYVRENRRFRDVILGLIERLRRDPPDDPASLLAFIFDHLPHFRKDS